MPTLTSENTIAGSSGHFNGIGSVATALLPLAGNLISGYLDREAANQNNRNTIAANRELAEYSYAKDLEMWNRTNQYNSPQSQMARLKAAGLNPNLVYGTGAVANSSGTPPRYNPPQVQYSQMPLFNIPQALSAYQDFALKSAQIDNVKANTESNIARTLTENSLRDDRGIMLRTQQSHEATKAGTTQIRQDLLRETFNSQADYAKGLLREQQLRLATGAKKIELYNQQKQLNESEILFRQFRNEFKRMGIESSDNILVRIIGRMLAESGFNLSDF